jgi:hypothetical protein
LHAICKSYQKNVYTQAVVTQQAKHRSNLMNAAAFINMMLWLDGMMMKQSFKAMQQALHSAALHRYLRPTQSAQVGPPPAWLKYETRPRAR